MILAHRKRTATVSGAKPADSAAISSWNPRQYGCRAPLTDGAPARYSGQRPLSGQIELMFLSRSTGRKIVATTTAAVTFALLYEVTTLDSRYAARQAERPRNERLPRPGARLRFTATGYCKGTTTASGVNVRTGIAAADPDLLPVGSVIQVDKLGREVQRHLHDHGHRPEGPGPAHRHLHVELPRGPGARPPRACRSTSCASAGTPRPARRPSSTACSASARGPGAAAAQPTPASPPAADNGGDDPGLCVSRALHRQVRRTQSTLARGSAVSAKLRRTALGQPCGETLSCPR